MDKGVVTVYHGKLSLDLTSRKVIRINYQWKYSLDSMHMQMYIYIYITCIYENELKNGTGANRKCYNRKSPFSEPLIFLVTVYHWKTNVRIREQTSLVRYYVLLRKGTNNVALRQTARDWNANDDIRSGKKIL